MGGRLKIQWLLLKKQNPLSTEYLKRCLNTCLIHDDKNIIIYRGGLLCILQKENQISLNQILHKKEENIQYINWFEKGEIDWTETFYS